MRDLIAAYHRLRSRGPVGRAVVTSVWGSAPRQPGAVLLANDRGEMEGSVSGGCVESDAVERIVAAIKAGTSSTVDFSVTHETAWTFGLSCGGTVSLWIQPEVPATVIEAASGAQGSAVGTVLGDRESAGSMVVLGEDGSVVNFGLPAEALDAVVERASAALQSLTSGLHQVATPAGDLSVMIEVFPRRPTLLVFGGVHIAEALVRLARPLGYRTVVADAREAFLTRDRFPEADELIVGWPAEVFERVGIDSATCICLLTHDPKFDEPAIEAAIKSPAAYIGAIGSRKTQQTRRERLRSAGFSEEEIARIHGPIGLDLGGREPGEIALSILAEITTIRFKGSASRVPASF